MTSEVLKIHQMSEMVGARTTTVKTWQDAGVHNAAVSGTRANGIDHSPVRPAGEQASDAALSPSDVIGVNR